MTNKLVSVGIAQTCHRFDGESSHWLSMSMRNFRLFQLGMRMGMEIYN